MPNAKELERHLVVKFVCPKGSIDRVKSLLSEFVDPARNEDGCLYYDLFHNIDDPTVFFILDGWADESAASRHGSHPNVKRVLEQLLPLLSSPPQILTNRRVSDTVQD